MEGSIYSSSPSTYVNESKKSETAIVQSDHDLNRKKRHNSHHSIQSNDSDCVHELHDHGHPHQNHQSPFSFRGRYFDSPNRDINVASPWFLCNRPQVGFNCAVHADGPPSFVPGVVNQLNNKPFVMPQQLFPEDGQTFPPPPHFIYTPPYSFPPPSVPWPPRPPPPHFATPFPHPQPPRFNSIYTTQPITVPTGVTTFQPIRTRCFTPMPRNLSPPNTLAAFSTPNAVELVVSNLDYNISAKEWRKILFTTFHPQVQVLNVFVKTQPDNTSIAMVKVPSVEDARFAISQFHRKKIGYKRIHVTLKNDDSQYLTTSTRTEVVGLLSEVHGGVLPLFKFIELFDKRYHRPISVSELYKMKDIIEISEQGGAGRMIYLRGSNTPSPETSHVEEPIPSEVLEVPVCHKHCDNTSTLNYIVAMNSSMLPTVRIDLKTLGAQVHSLLQDHAGTMHLMSFTACYEAKFPALKPHESGVPLEHLISCVPGVQIHLTKNGVKKVQWTENRPMDSPGSSSSQGSNSPLLSQQLSQISRELVDLLKHSPNTRMPFSKFIPTYHHHFDRQCRVADYGYTRLHELFEAIPHVLQVMGVGDRKVLTLTHRAQVRRFTSDLVRILKTYTNKEMRRSALNDSFEKVNGKALEITDYGVCSVEDMLDEISSHSVVVSQEGGETILSIPRKDQTHEETERTKQFGLEVIDLLKHNPQCRMPFNKFIPSYHHHFGRQCRVADYGFTKLHELFECLPHIVKQIEEVDERIIALTEPELRRVMSEQIVRLLQTQPSQRVPVSDFHQKFSSHYGFTILLEDFGVASISELLGLFKHVIKFTTINGSPYISLIQHTHSPLLAHQILLLLMDQSGGSLPLVELCSRYRSLFDADCDVARVREQLVDYVQISGDDQSGVISLTPLQSLARDLRTLLLSHSSQLPFHRIEYEYLQKFGVEIKPALYGYTSVYALLKEIPHIVTVTGTGIKRVVQLCPEFQNNSMSQPLSPLMYQHDQNFNDVATFNDSYTSGHDHYTSPPYSKASDTSGFVSGRQSFDTSHHTTPPPDAHHTTSPPDITTRQERDANKLPSPKELIWSDPEGRSRDQNRRTAPTPTSELLHLAAQCLPDQDTGDGGGKVLPVTTESKNVAKKPDAFITKFTGGWWKASSEQLHNLPIIKNHMQKIKADEKIPEFYETYDEKFTGNFGAYGGKSSTNNKVVGNIGAYGGNVAENHRLTEKFSAFGGDIPPNQFAEKFGAYSGNIPPNPNTEKFGAYSGNIPPNHNTEKFGAYSGNIPPNPNAEKFGAYAGNLPSNQRSGNVRGGFGDKFDNPDGGIFSMNTPSFDTTVGAKGGIFPFDHGEFPATKFANFNEKPGDFQAKRSDYERNLYQMDPKDEMPIPTYKPTVFRDVDEDRCRLPKPGDSRNTSPNAKTGIFGSPGLCHISKLLDFDVNEIKLDRSYEMRSKLRKPTRSDTTSILSSMTLEGTSANNSFLDDIPIDTSSVKSDDCGLTFRAAQSPPKKTRIAANFAAPYQMSWNY